MLLLKNYSVFLQQNFEVELQRLYMYNFALCLFDYQTILKTIIIFILFILIIIFILFSTLNLKFQLVSFNHSVCQIMLISLFF